MRSAIEVANWMIRNGAEYQLSNLKIQKLLYIAFGSHAADYNEHLFYDPIEAWKYGPVIQCVYHSLKFYCSNAIHNPIEMPDGSIPMLRDDERLVISTLEDTLHAFGQKSALELMHWSHTKGGPWDRTYDRERGGLQEIDKQLIRRSVIEELGWSVPRAGIRAIRA